MNKKKLDNIELGIKSLKIGTKVYSLSPGDEKIKGVVIEIFRRYDKRKRYKIRWWYGRGLKPWDITYNPDEIRFYILGGNLKIYKPPKYIQRWRKNLGSE